MTPKSGVLLAGSCVAAIAAVGSIFELSSGTPDWGTGPHHSRTWPLCSPGWHSVLCRG